MRKFFPLFVFLVFSVTSVCSQKIAVKSNLLYDLTTTMNLGVELSLDKNWTFDLSANYNPWKFGDKSDVMRLRHWLVQPELRYWTCEKFKGHFLGIHGHYGDYNVGGMNFLSDNMKKSRYQGTLYGAGLSYGYQWPLNNRWNMEAVIGAGWAHLDQDKYPCAECGDKAGKDRDYFGVTKVALSLIYFIK